jgi:hypothetical protein
MSEKPAVKMAIAYDCFSAGALAVARMQPLCDRLQSDLEIHTAFWSFEEIQHLPRQEARATAEMLEADIVIFATMDSAVLPARIREWAESWAPAKRARASLLVALVGSAARCLDGFFRQLSELGGMDFFCESLEASAEETVSAAPAFLGLDERYLLPAVRLASQRNQPYQLRDWGIND